MTDPGGRRLLAAVLAALAGAASGCGDEAPSALEAPPDVAEEALDARLRAELEAREFTGRVASTLEARLGRPLDPRLAELGRLLFFDPVLSLTGDNSCAGCHGPNVAFNDSRPISVGVGNNGVVGPGRRGPHNLRRAPTLLNAAFHPRLMWDGRFHSVSLDAFDGSWGFVFPPPDGSSLSHLDHLLVAQAFTPVVAREEMAGFEAPGDARALRSEVARRVGDVAAYRSGFAEVFPEVTGGGPVAFEHVARALAEFLFTLVRADAPLDRFARGEADALGPDEKRGALLFFGRAMCGECHIVRGYANEMFSDFEPHVLGVPQVVPARTNVRFDGPGADEDYGLERVTGREEDRYKFRTSPLRNVAFQPSFMHNGAYVCLEDAVRHHLDAVGRARRYSPEKLGPDFPKVGPAEPVLDRLHDLVRSPPSLTERDVRRIVAFLRDGLSDPAADPRRLRSLVPASVPSGLPVHRFEFDPARRPEC